LKCVVVDESLLQRMQRSFGSKPFDCRDLGAIFHASQCQAGIDPPSLDQDGAGAALAVIAALFRSGQVEAIAQRVQQRGPRRNGQLALGAVDKKGDVHGSRSGDRFQWSRRGTLGHRILQGAFASSETGISDFGLARVTLEGISGRAMGSATRCLRSSTNGEDVRSNLSKEHAEIFAATGADARASCPTKPRRMAADANGSSGPAARRAEALVIVDSARAMSSCSHETS
jgi:hypothetical protein